MSLGKPLTTFLKDALASEKERVMTEVYILFDWNGVYSGAYKSAQKAQDVFKALVGHTRVVPIWEQSDDRFWYPQRGQKFGNAYILKDIVHE
jgi:hypothetical protein